MDRQIQNKVIQIAKIEQTNPKVIKLHDQDKLKYDLWVKLADGSRNTKAYDQFKIMDLMIGSTVEISYNEEPASFQNAKGETVAYTKRPVVGFRETDQLADPGKLQESKRVVTKTFDDEKQEEFENRQAFGKRLAIHGMVNGLLAGGENPHQVRAALKDLVELEDAIEDALKGKFINSQVDLNEIDPSEIPF